MKIKRKYTRKVKKEEEVKKAVPEENFPVKEPIPQKAVASESVVKGSSVGNISVQPTALCECGQLSEVGKAQCYACSHRT
jgi:hypothetical protein